MNERAEEIASPSEAGATGAMEPQTSQQQDSAGASGASSSAPSSAPSGPAIEFKGLSQPVLRVILRETSISALRETLDRLSPKGEADFEWQAAVLDLEQSSSQSADLEGICALLREMRLHPVAVAGADDALREQAEALQLGWLSALHEPRRPASRAGEHGQDDPSALAADSRTARAGNGRAHAESNLQGKGPGAAMTVDRPVRSGQQIYARDNDLVVIGPVSPGAEVIADGNVHIYGSLQGRAIAGARGRRDARIFAMDLSAELVAIAGVYRTFEDGVPASDRGRPVCICLDGDSDRLAIKAI